MNDDIQMIADPRWFYRINDTFDPWQNWFAMLDFPHQHDPLDADLEHQVEDLCQAADVHRLTITPSTEHFAAM